MTIILDTPAQIQGWYFLSAVSQLAFELKSGHNWYGKTSVLKGIQARGWAPAGRATRRAKILALAHLLDEQPAGPVIDLARTTLQEALDADGLVLTRA